MASKRMHWRLPRTWVPACGAHEDSPVTVNGENATCLACVRLVNTQTERIRFHFCAHCGGKLDLSKNDYHDGVMHKLCFRRATYAQQEIASNAHG